MGLRIQNNVEAFNTHRQLTATSPAASKSMEKLSSGYRINRAADDAAGLAISEKMRGQIGGLAQAQRNAQDGISLVQTAEGALTEVHSMLQRIRDLKVQSLNDTLQTEDKDAIAAEVFQLGEEITKIGTDTAFNGTKLLDTATTLNFQVGANDGETITASAVAWPAAPRSRPSSASPTRRRWRRSASPTSTRPSRTSPPRVRHFGAVQNRLEHRLNNLATYQENLTASESRIRDVDMADEMTKFTKLNILQQAGTSMLAQANQGPQGVLRAAALEPARSLDRGDQPGAVDLQIAPGEVAAAQALDQLHGAASLVSVGDAGAVELVGGDPGRVEAPGRPERDGDHRAQRAAPAGAEVVPAGEVAERVRDQPVLVELQPAQDVRARAEHEVGAGVDRRVREVPAVAAELAERLLRPARDVLRCPRPRRPRAGRPRRCRPGPRRS